MSKKRTVIFIIALILVAGGVGYAVFHFVGQARRNAIYNEIRPAESRVIDTGDHYQCPIDFEGLWAINPDVYAWIEIPGTGISYPILQGGPTDSYYLDHTIEHQEGFPGSIYTHASRNSKTFEEFNTVIYGHELDDNTMFTQLHNYWDKDFFDTHREIKIYLPDKELTYTVFGQVTYNDDLILHYYNNDIPEDRTRFLDSVYNNRNLNDIIADDISVTADSQIITLSTCIYYLPSNRCLVLAVKTGEKQ